MAWFRVKLTEEEQRIVKEDRECHPEDHVRRKMWVIWMLVYGNTTGNLIVAEQLSPFQHPPDPFQWIVHIDTKGKKQSMRV
jgi:hypothetical protein